MNVCNFQNTRRVPVSSSDTNYRIKVAHMITFDAFKYGTRIIYSRLVALLTKPLMRCMFIISELKSAIFHTLVRQIPE